MNLKVEYVVRRECERWVKILEINGVKEKSELPYEYISSGYRFWKIGDGIGFWGGLDDINVGEELPEIIFKSRLEKMREGIKRLKEIKEANKKECDEWGKKGMEIIEL